MRGGGGGYVECFDSFLFDVSFCVFCRYEQEMGVNATPCESCGHLK